MSRRKINDMTPLARLRILNRRDFTMEKAAAAMEINIKTLWTYENGISDVPAEIIKKMAFFYGVSELEVLEAAHKVREKYLATQAEKAEKGEQS